ncbi:hypothetical protein AY606_06765 [Acinetobacter sp. SFB]|uniref:hypothetical protein n=1 Tax=Acinetobacter sp. SFB TaxID=1805634 RepID=UPI0007D77AC9|nr:hypothetical protein [Acinetobacter sp. SFB]OAL79125.1 hypothetical protein AY606_06765 [Acinetobacter sp. SFB]
MHMKPVKVYKMNKDFKISPKLIYMGEYNLMNVYDSLQEKLTRIMGTYQWILNSTGEVFFYSRRAS